MPKHNYYDITKDPKTVKSRVFLGNLPICTRRELKRFCQLLGKVLETRIEGRYGYVQFETEFKAQVAAIMLDTAIFKSNMLVARSTNFKLMEELYGNSKKTKRTRVPAPPSNKQFRRPGRIQTLLKKLVDYHPLTVLQYNDIISKLEAERKELQNRKDSDDFLYPSF
ncbi:hypothetical protein M5D96_012722 [Drosophila gunungcola]|uniref:RRM domain-containing protein n=1 Tax=Drosophila gunungcola TaxID=103775 RepID=A0A9Q0BK35_9MUSC|nr:hypothetical protein M5D96_012722 [Drosophila gunungcola]